MAPTTDNPTGHADSGEKKQTPATFIMGLPPDMPATDVVARGKKAGLVFTESWVYKVRRAARAEKTQRGAARAKGTKSRAATSPTAAPKPVGTRPRGAPSGPKRAGGTPGERPLSKQEFIRSFPVGMNAAEVIEIAQGMGIQLTFGELIEAMSAPPGPAEGTLKRPGRAAEESSSSSASGSSGSSKSWEGSRPESGRCAAPEGEPGGPSGPPMRCRAGPTPPRSAASPGRRAPPGRRSWPTMGPRRAR
jgi:hypothetical protein